MSMHELVAAVEAQGIHLRVVDSELRVRPRSRVSPGLLETLRRHKQELLDHLAGEGQEAPTDAESVAAMTLGDFATAGLIVEIYSEALGIEVLLVSDNVREERLESETRPIYRAGEMRNLALLRPGPSSLRQIHEVKMVFGGTITGVEPAEEIGGHDE